MINIEDYGFNYSQEIMKENAIAARITAVHKERYTVVCAYGEIPAILKSSVYYNGAYEEYPVIGDFVLINYNDKGDSPVIKTLPRKSYFSRSNNFGKLGEQAIAANFDHVFILMSLNRDFNIARLERYMAMAWQSSANPVVVLTKADLCEDVGDFLTRAEISAVGAQIFAVSSLNGEGIEEVKSIIKPRQTVVFLGSSGAGKSTLINALAGEDIMKTGEIREDDARGRHTTTHRQLIMTKENIMVIDTPGMRELGIWDAGEGLSDAFSDVEEFIGNCRFSNCSHTNEPGCAVLEALGNGGLSEERWKRYLKLQNENLFSQDKKAYAKMWKEKFKNMEQTQRYAYRSGKGR